MVHHTLYGQRLLGDVKRANTHLNEFTFGKRKKKTKKNTRPLITFTLISLYHLSLHYSVAHHFGYTVAARPGDVELFTWIRDRVNLCYMRVPWRIAQKLNHYYENDETFIWDKVNKCEMKINWNVFMNVRLNRGALEAICI